MSQNLLEPWDALELFCRIEEKFISRVDKLILTDEEQKTIKEQMTDVVIRFNQKQELVEISRVFQKAYSNTALCKIIWKDIKTVVGTETLGTSDYEMSVYHFCSGIRAMGTVRIVPQILTTMEAYIDEPNYLKGRRRKLEVKQNIQIDEIKFHYEHSCWWIYNFEERNAKGVVKGIINFKPLGGAVIETLKQKVSDHEIFIGSFNFSSNYEFLSIKLNLEGFHLKDLQMRIYLGESPKEVSLGLGIYQNFFRDIYAGKVMIKPLSKDEAKQYKKEFSEYYQNKTQGIKTERNIAPEFILLDDSNLDKEVKTFFSIKENQEIVRVAGDVTSIATFNYKFEAESPDNSE